MIKVERNDYDGPVDIELEANTLDIEWLCDFPEEITAARSEVFITLSIACRGRDTQVRASGQILVTAYACDDRDIRYKTSIPVVYNKNLRGK